MLARAHLPTVDHLANVEAVAQQISEGTTREGNAPDGPPVRKPPHLGHDPALAQLAQELIEAAEVAVALKDQPHPLGLLLDHDNLPVAALVAERDHAPNPEPLALRGR